MGINCLLSVVAGGPRREWVVSMHHPGGRKEVREPGKSRAADTANQGRRYAPESRRGQFKVEPD